jgi:hypothetical protein
MHYKESRRGNMVTRITLCKDCLNKNKYNHNIGIVIKSFVIRRYCNHCKKIQNVKTYTVYGFKNNRNGGLNICGDAKV